MSTLFGKAALTAATMALGSVTLAPADALAMEESCHTETHSLAYSGWSLVEYSRDNRQTWQTANAIAPWAGWAVIPGTSYVNFNTDYNGDIPQSWVHYRTTFSVPQVPYGSTLDWDRLTVEVHADNSARVYLDGDVILQQPLAEDMNNFQGLPSQYVSFPFLVESGSHELAFDVFNYSGPTGLDFNVTYQRRLCVPCIGPSRLGCPAL